MYIYTYRNNDGSWYLIFFGVLNSVAGPLSSRSNLLLWQPSETLSTRYHICTQ